MKVLILGGFLGSGKTTVLLKLAPYITANSKSKMPLAIIENEIGDIGVDSAVLSGFQVWELFSGCICCTLTAGLGSAIRKLHQEYDPEYVVVEATGLAHVDKIVDVIHQYLPEVDWLKTVVLADAARWDDLVEGLEVFMEKQLQGGDVVLLNKCDMVTQDEQIRLAEEMKRIHPTGQLLMISANDDITEEIKIILEQT